jgi:hypothetical protein
MSWSLKGSYVETCSCELMCQCNLSFDHGATYDYCRSRSSSISAKEEIDGTDVAGLKIAAIKVTDDSVRHSVRIGDAIDFEIEDIVPFGVETGQPVRFNGMFHPVGSDLAMAEAKRSDINAFGVQYEGKTGLSTAEFAWAA